MKRLLDPEMGSGRIGLLAVVGYLNDLKKPSSWIKPPALQCQVCDLIDLLCDIFQLLRSLI